MMKTVTISCHLDDDDDDDDDGDGDGDGDGDVMMIEEDGGWRKMARGNVGKGGGNRRNMIGKI